MLKFSICSVFTGARIPYVVYGCFMIMVLRSDPEGAIGYIDVWKKLHVSLLRLMYLAISCWLERYCNLIENFMLTKKLCYTCGSWVGVFNIFGKFWIRLLREGWIICYTENNDVINTCEILDDYLSLRNVAWSHTLAICGLF